MIVADHLTRRFPGREAPAVDDVSFRVGSGEAVALMGRNGAGKTSLLDVFATLLLPSSGRAAIGGCDVAREPDAVRRLVGYAGSGPRGFYIRLTARQNLRFFAALHPAVADADARVAELTDQLGLGPFIDAPVRTCSDGMQQRLVIARALVGRPRVVLLDEPARALDVVARAMMARVLRDLLAQGAIETVLHATHDLDALPDLATRVLVMDRGRCAYDGPPEAARVRALLATGGRA